MVEASKKQQKKEKKLNFTDCKPEITADRRKSVVFGSLSSGMTNKMKQVEWQKVTVALNAVSSEPKQEVP